MSKEGSYVGMRKYTLGGGLVGWIGQKTQTVPKGGPYSDQAWLDLVLFSFTSTFILKCFHFLSVSLAASD